MKKTDDPLLLIANDASSAGGAMEPGYYIVEPDELGAVACNLNNGPLSVALLHWLAAAMQRELEAQREGGQMAVIVVEYLGAYPGLGFTYPGRLPDGLTKRIDALATRLLKERPVSDFLKYVASSRVDWNARFRDLMSK